MRDLDQAAALGIDTSDMVVVTHPDKRSRFGGTAEFTMTRLAYVKRGMEQRGYEIVGDAGTVAKPTSREQSLLAEVDALRRQLAEKTDASSSSPSVAVDGDKTALQARLDALGVKYHHNAGVTKLQEQLVEALAALSDDFSDEDDDES